MIRFFTLLTFIWLCFLQCTDTSPSEQVSKNPISKGSNLAEMIDSIVSTHAPDKRVSLVNVDWAEGSQVMKGETNQPDAYQALQTIIKDYELLDSLVLLPRGKFKKQPFGLINISTCNIRAESRHSSELSTQATLGTPIKVYKQKGGWYYVQTPDGYLGWLNEGTFVSLSSEAFDDYKAEDKVIFIKESGKVFKNSNLKGESLCDLTMGNILIFRKMHSLFAEIELPDGRIGFVFNDDITPWQDWQNRMSRDRSQLLATAKSLLGRPYLWGGTSSKAMDCSGFTKTVFFAHHMILPRDASQQVHTGELITKDVNELTKAQPGDLLFFGRMQEDREKVTHVGIYLGDDRMIHAGDGRVQIQSLNPQHEDYIEKRRTSFLRAKDMLSNVGKNGVIKVSDSSWY